MADNEDSREDWSMRPYLSLQIRSSLWNLNVQPRWQSELTHLSLIVDVPIREGGGLLFLFPTLC